MDMIIISIPLLSHCFIMEACMTFVRDIVERAFDQKLPSVDQTSVDTNNHDIKNDDNKSSDEYKYKYDDGKIHLEFAISNISNINDVHIFRSRYESEYFNYKNSNDSKDADRHIREYVEMFERFNHHTINTLFFQNNQCTSIDQLIERILSGTKTTIWGRTFFVNNTGQLMCKIQSGFGTKIKFCTLDSIVQRIGLMDDLKLIYQEQ
jgi:hypothetical protein